MFDSRKHIASRIPMILRFHRSNYVPTVVIDMDVPISGALNWLKQQARQEQTQGPRPGLVHLVIKAAALALGDNMILNYKYNGLLRLIPDNRISISCPFQAGSSAAHALIPEPQDKTVFQIARDMAQSQDQIRQALPRNESHQPRTKKSLLAGMVTTIRYLAMPLVHRIPHLDRQYMDDLSERTGSFRVADLASLGITACHGQLAKPNIAALSFLSVREDVKLEKGQAVVHQTLPLVLEFDHKILDAGTGSRFLKQVAQNLTEPERCR